VKDDPVSVQVLEQLAFQVYPNPTSQFMTVKSQAAIEMIQILDLAGKIVLQSTQQELDLQSLISGSYILEVISNGEVSRKKVQKI
jgi:hypothetical protein